MATKLITLKRELQSYTQSEEDTLASSLTGNLAYSSIIWNSTLKTIRFWNGATFESTNTIPFVEAKETGNIHIGTTAPTNPVTNKTLWIDTN